MENTNATRVRVYRERSTGEAQRESGSGQFASVRKPTSEPSVTPAKAADELPPLQLKVLPKKA
ncbi:MAG TPA: hypothetical protein VIJ96_14930 [Acidothermaceae bacterium]